VYALILSFCVCLGLLGQQARESLLLCVSLSSKSPALEQYIAHLNPQYVVYALILSFCVCLGLLGQQARESLLLCVSLSSKSPALEQYIAHHSNFCTILATGTNGFQTLEDLSHNEPPLKEFVDSAMMQINAMYNQCGVPVCAT
jgi:hypothetical protein